MGGAAAVLLAKEPVVWLKLGLEPRRNRVFRGHDKEFAACTCTNLVGIAIGGRQFELHYSFTVQYV